MFAGADEDCQYGCSEKASSHFRININDSCMLIRTGLGCRTRAVAMDSLPTKDTNGPVLRDGKLKNLNSCWGHFNTTESVPITTP